MYEGTLQINKKGDFLLGCGVGTIVPGESQEGEAGRGARKGKGSQEGEAEGEGGDATGGTNTL